MQDIIHKVQEIVEIINGKLVNTPSIGGFCGYCTRADRVQRGSLFFALDVLEIESALQKGAFGIVFETNAQTSLHDEEVAWIQVDSITEAIIRLARYELLSRHITMIALTPTQYAIAQSLIRAKSVLFFDENPIDLLDALESKPTIILAKSQRVLEMAVNSMECSTPEELPFTLSQSAMFETRFYYKLNAYRLPIPSVFVPELAAVLSMCINHRIECDFTNFEPITELLPISLTNTARVLDFGESARVIIPTNEADIFVRYGAFLHEQARWAKVAVFMPHLYDEKESISTAYENLAHTPLQAIEYNSSTELPLLLQQTQYNFGLVFGISTQGLLFVLSQNKPEQPPTLF